MGNSPTGEDSDEVVSTSPVQDTVVQPQSFSIYCINIRSLIDKLAELTHQLNSVQPHIVFINETWLDNSTEKVDIPNYVCISRKDRAQTENRGGVICYAHINSGHMIFLEKSDTAERSWHLIQRDSGNISCE